MRAFLCIPVTLAAGIATSLADVESEQTRAAMAITGALPALQSTAVDYARSQLPPNAVKGIYGESVAHRVMQSQLLTRDSWHAITPRSGPQGFDHLHIRLDSSGNPIDMVVGETKYGSSRLGMTKDGIQLGRDWVRKRLHGLGKRYLVVAASEKIVAKKLPFSPGRQVSVVLSNGRQCHFWKASSQDPNWHYDGKADDLAEARKKASSMGDFLCKAAKGEVPYRVVHHQVHSTQKMTITWYTHDRDGRRILLSKNVLSLSPKFSTTGVLTTEAEKELAKLVLKQMPWLTNGEARQLAREINRSGSSNKLLSGVSRFLVLGRATLMNGGIAGALDAGMGLVEGGALSLGRTATTFGVAGVGGTVQGLLRGGVLGNICSGSSAGYTGGFASGGGLLAAAFVAVEAYHALAGAQDATTMARNSALALSGPLASAATFGLVAAFGTASTGTAISSLSGIAAYNAAMAWLGGGSIAAGGYGMLLGGAVLGGVAVVATAALYMCFRMYDAAQERTRITLKVNWLNDPNVLRKVIKSN